MRKRTSGFVLFLILLPFPELLAQYRTGPYAPPVGQNGTTAMHMDSSAFIAWADDCQVRRGPKDTSDLSKGYASAGSPSDATGKADNAGVVSLGDGGHATLKFDSPIRNGTGPDLAVFENSFSDDFLELAFVEVSSNGEDFVRFPAHSLTDTSTQVGSFGSLDATELNKLAGKYRGGYGTPFDLEELNDSSGIDLQSVTHVRIVDAIGCIQDGFASYDKDGRKVNDPWPTAFESGGFDLDAVGVIHGQGSGLNAHRSNRELDAYFDPSERSIRVKGEGKVEHLELYDLQGRKKAVWRGNESGRYPLRRDLSGPHVLKLAGEEGMKIRKLMLQR